MRAQAETQWGRERRRAGQRRKGGGKKKGSHVHPFKCHEGRLIQKKNKGSQRGKKMETCVSKKWGRGENVDYRKRGGEKRENYPASL